MITDIYIRNNVRFVRRVGFRWLGLLIRGVCVLGVIILGGSELFGGIFGWFFYGLTFTDLYSCHSFKLILIELTIFKGYSCIHPSIHASIHPSIHKTSNINKTQKSIQPKNPIKLILTNSFQISPQNLQTRIHR